MDRITRIRIRNVRAIEAVEMHVSRPITVLIGENGAGKSTILEVLELLRKAADPNFMQLFYSLHRGLPALLRKGATIMEVGVVIEDDAEVLPRIDYSFKIAPQGTGAVIAGESLLLGPTALVNAGLVADPALAALRREHEALATTLREQSEHVRALEQAVESATRRVQKLEGSGPKRPPSQVGGLEAAQTNAKNRKRELAAARSEHLQAQASAGRLEERVRELERGPASRRGEALPLISRDTSGASVFDEARGTHKGVGVALTPDRLLITANLDSPLAPAIPRLLSALRGIEVHLGFDSIAAWAARTYQRPLSIRGGATLFPASRLDLLGVNLTNAWSELRNRDSQHWQRTMDIVRLGLGERVDTVLVPPDSGGGNVYLAVRFEGVPEPVLAADLSDGQIAWLAFVAMARLNSGRSLLAVDEPDIHLHPQLLGGVVALLESIDAPVVLTTHSDRVLELLSAPGEAVRVCALNEAGQAEIAQVDPEALSSWLGHYGDLGRLRAAGYLSRVLTPPGDAT